MFYQDSDESSWILFMFCRAVKVYKSKELRIAEMSGQNAPNYISFVEESALAPLL